MGSSTQQRKKTLSKKKKKKVMMMISVKRKGLVLRKSNRVHFLSLLVIIL